MRLLKTRCAGGVGAVADGRGVFPETGGGGSAAASNTSGATLTGRVSEMFGDGMMLGPRASLADGAVLADGAMLAVGGFERLGPAPAGTLGDAAGVADDPGRADMRGEGGSGAAVTGTDGDGFTGSALARLVGALEGEAAGSGSAPGNDTAGDDAPGAGGAEAAEPLLTAGDGESSSASAGALLTM